MSSVIGGIILWLVLVLLAAGYFVAKKYGENKKDELRLIIYLILDNHKILIG
jgi:hypothetical protein